MSRIVFAGAFFLCARLFRRIAQLEQRGFVCYNEKHTTRIPGRKKEKLTCNICDFGALGDGKALNTDAIQAAIDACTAAGGGRVAVPAGKFLSGTLCLKSNVELHLESAELIASLDPADMPDMLGAFEDDNRDTGWEGGCFFLARHAENITISGFGRIDGRGREVFFMEAAGLPGPGLSGRAAVAARRLALRGPHGLCPLGRRDLDPRSRPFHG